jgi:peptidyl-prolyl cis-trans isomerase B (cyclophilin B)
MNRLIFILSFCALVFSACNKDDFTYAEIETEFGTMKVKLYNSTPKHRDNFIKLANEGFYDDLLFHRVISGFMVQGGDPDSKGAAPDARLGGGGPGYLIDEEIGALHVKGALAAARTSNPEKKSSGSQYYIVQGKPQSDGALDAIESQKGVKYSPEQRELYKTLGGTPQLDNEYTVFGEVVEGIEVVDKIAAVQTAPGDRPLEDVKMKVRILN